MLFFQQPWLAARCMDGGAAEAAAPTRVAAGARTRLGVVSVGVVGAVGVGQGRFTVPVPGAGRAVGRRHPPPSQVGEQRPPSAEPEAAQETCGRAGLSPGFVGCFSCPPGDGGLTSRSLAGGVESCPAVPAPGQGSCGGSGLWPGARGPRPLHWERGFGEQRCPFGWDVGPRWGLGVCHPGVTLAWQSV